MRHHSFMHYVRYIMSVHFCTERSERSQTVWLIPFLYTLSGLELKLCWFIKDAQVLPVLVLNRYTQLFHLYLPMTTHSLCWWTGLLMGRKSSFPHALHPSCLLLSHNCTWFLGLQFNFARQRWHQLCRLPRRCSLSFFDSFDSSVQMIITGIVQRSPGCQPWSNTHREWARRGSEPSKPPVYPASDWQIPCCCNNLPRGEDVKNPLMLRWENCMHRRFKPKLSNLKRKDGKD